MDLFEKSIREEKIKIDCILIYGNFINVYNIFRKIYTSVHETYSIVKFKWIFLIENFQYDYISLTKFNHIVNIAIIYQAKNKTLQYSNLSFHRDNNGNRLWQFWGNIGNRSLSNLLLFPYCNYGLNKMKLRIATKSWPAYSAWNENIGNFEGLSIELLKYVMNDLNFTTEKIQTPEDDKWGSLENNTWNGLIKMLMDNKTDAVFAPLTPLKDRQDVMDFSLPYHFVRPMLIFKNHLHENNSNERGEFFFLQPFSNITWILICVSVAVMGFLLMALEKQKSYIFSTEHLFFLGTLFNQGGGYGINSKGYVRIILSGWWIFSITMVAFFSGKIIADLAVYKAKYPFDTLEDLVYSKDYTLITLGDAAYESLLKNSKSWTYQALWAKIAKAARDNPDVRHTDEKVIIQLVLNVSMNILSISFHLKLTMHYMNILHHMKKREDTYFLRVDTSP
ncbi:DgyrCDS12881 [Dimorphilus gyrociliatus]|uniref:DgyrCDS12881 n=1 Tax=Dimorphilus gyrociliatus TaxID=2664684 RepID=A0A7I8W915_9ANNE|nr:DgyrCDS12881 [Dimorphilus gyrociliatus]